MRSLNQIRLIDNELVVLGPGGTWKDVLEKFPPTEFTMIHGQCTSVGVAGYLLGGGINFLGTSNKYGSGADHVIQYTMVDAKGRILLVSDIRLDKKISKRISQEIWSVIFLKSIIKQNDRHVYQIKLSVKLAYLCSYLLILSLINQFLHFLALMEITFRGSCMSIYIGTLIYKWFLFLTIFENNYKIIPKITGLKR